MNQALQNNNSFKSITDVPEQFTLTTDKNYTTNIEYETKQFNIEVDEIDYFKGELGANGNITKVTRDFDLQSSTPQLDELNYTYNANKINSLTAVNDVSNNNISGNYLQGNNSYTYNSVGQKTSQVLNNVTTNIEYDYMGMVTLVSSDEDIEYKYNENGYLTQKIDFYNNLKIICIRDLSGNILSID